jgi:16S rRNA (adenine1518-N6/adenine1519-N6)-dimethyltransferase
MVCFANAPEDNPFMAGAFHGPGEPECVINVGVSGPGVVRSALAKLPAEADLTEVAEVIKRTAFKITRLGQLVGQEAAERLCAELPSRAAGAVTAAVRWYSEPDFLFEVSREAFSPPPDVDSAVIRLNVRKTPPVAVMDEAMFFRVIKGAFAQRRKTVLNSISTFFRMDKPAMADILAAAGVSANARAEQLALEDFAKIADGIDFHGQMC